jgi:hypothetical protein
MEKIKLKSGLTKQQKKGKKGELELLPFVQTAN